MTNLSIMMESWPIRGSFTIARGTKTRADVIVARLEDGAVVGRGECVPYARYGETPEDVAQTLRSLIPAVTQGMTREQLQNALPAGAARNALDCAFWDLEAKQKNTPVWQLAGLTRPEACLCAYTLSLDTPENMYTDAKSKAGLPLLKVKTGGEGDEERLCAIREAAPAPALILDANESWTPRTLERRLSQLAPYRIDLVEQPVPSDQDACLEELESPVPLCADESCHSAQGQGAEDFDRLARRYQAINIKLDKTGGLTQALHLLRAARARNLGIMVGCMVATSLAMAPATLLTPHADYVDLDGPLLLSKDRVPGLRYREGILEPPPATLWG